MSRGTMFVRIGRDEISEVDEGKEGTRKSYIYTAAKSSFKLHRM